MKDDRTYKIIGAAMEVHKQLGCGFLEAVYQAALEREFRIQEIPFISQYELQIVYKGVALNKAYIADFACYDSIIVEIKALSKMSGTEDAQVINYLKASKLKIGLLFNFGAKSLEYKRFIHTHNP